MERFKGLIKADLMCQAVKQFKETVMESCRSKKYSPKDYDETFWGSRISSTRKKAVEWCEPLAQVIRDVEKGCGADWKTEAFDVIDSLLLVETKLGLPFWDMNHIYTMIDVHAETGGYFCREQHTYSAKVCARYVVDEAVDGCTYTGWLIDYVGVGGRMQTRHTVYLTEHAKQVIIENHSSF